MGIGEGVEGRRETVRGTHPKVVEDEEDRSDDLPPLPFGKPRTPTSLPSYFLAKSNS